jgi:type VI secretion system protein ImpL
MKLKKLFSAASWLKSKINTKIIFAILLLLVIWAILPFIPIDGVHPFASIGVRFALTGLLVGGVGLWYGIGFLQRYKLKSWTVLQTAFSTIWQRVRDLSQNGWRYSKEYYNDVHDKLHSDRKRRRLKRLPWYLVLGANQSGKKTFIQQSGLYFQRPEHIGEEAVNYINEFPDFEWWFTQQAILVDVMSDKAEEDVNRWKKFVKLLKRERKARPFNGVIMTMSVSDLLLLSNKNRQDLITRYTQYIRDIYSVFKAHVPIYIVFNKCDLVDGFMEFFENLSKEELTQVWGMTLPLEGCNDLQTVLAFFNREYSGLLQQLRKRVMWAFESEKSMRGRELINAFPQQMNLFRKPIENFIAELFGATRYQRAIQCRGIYFTSSTQGQGAANDFLLQAMSKKFQLVPPQFNRPQRIGESYFTRGLFFEVMLPEAGLLGNSERRKKIQQFLYRATLIGCPMVVVALGIGMHEGSVANKRNLQAVDHYIESYKVADEKISKGNLSLTDTLPALEQLQQAKALYTTNSDFGLGLLWTSHHIKNTIIDTEQRALHSIFLPRVAANLEKSLKGNISDQNILYADLKGYLVFSSADYANKFALNAPMEYQWDQDFAAHPEVAQELGHFLNVALQEPIEKQPVNSILIGRIRSQLAQVNPAERAYGLLSLRANVGDDSAIYLSSASGNGFAQVFQETKTNYAIPSLYTKRAYENVFIKQYESIAEEVAQDNRDIGLSNANDASSTKGSLENSLQTTYNQRYIHTWDNALNNVTVKPFTSLNDAVNVLDVLVSNNSPLAQLLNIVYDNTSGVSHDEVDVESHFKQVNSYTESAGWGTSWHDTSKVLTKLRDYLVKLQQSPDQDNASFMVAEAVIEGKAANPMKQLTDLANKSPEPVKRWLMSLANNCWQIIIRGAHNEMNTAWNNNVIPSYNNGMRGRFPVAEHADSSVTMDSFNQLLGYGAALETYFNKYIKPFVNTEGDQWKLYSQHGLTIEIPQAHIDVFQRANAIRQEYFPSGAKQASLHMTIKPLTLDKSATSVEFVMGPQVMKYSHGPQNETSITWPLPFNSEDSRIVITTFNADQYAHSSSGAWSLFRMFHYGVFKPAGNDGSYQFDINFRGHTASFAISGPSDIDIFTLKQLIGFELPEVLAPSSERETTIKEKRK